MEHLGDSGMDMLSSANVVTTSPRFMRLGNLPQQLRDIGIPKHVGPNWRLVFSEGDQDGCFFVERGLIEGGSVNELGDETVTFIFGEQSMFLETTMFEGEMMAHSSTAPLFRSVTDTDLIFFPRRDITALVRKDAEVANYVAHAIAQKMVVFRSLYNESRYHSMLWRVTNLILSFAESYGTEQGSRLKLDYAISQNLIARMLGANRVSVTRSVKQLKEKGLIEKTNDQYYVTDLDALKEFFGSVE